MADLRTIYANRIVRDPGVMTGKPIVKGTRITVELILTEIAAGTTSAQLLEAYPHLSEADIRAAVAYAADFLTGDEIRAAE
jgi:uncharacterized protein (DUF433 family)